MEPPDHETSRRYYRGLLPAFLGDGRPFLILVGLSLVLAGGFALFLALTRQFLPHDIQFLNMTAVDLCAIQDCRIVDFMVHDRAAFGGAVIAVGMLYLWLAEFPLRQKEVWSWWVLLISGVFGFGSFLGYVGYGYLDTWHGLVTLLLLPLFATGLFRSFKGLPQPRHIRALLRPGVPLSLRTPFGLGRSGLLLVTFGMVAAGATILGVGMTSVFVPQDLVFMHLQPVELNSLNPQLIPLIAHDRAGFGGAILTIGLTAFFIVWCARPAVSLWQALGIAGLFGFGAAIGIHLWVGYLDFTHLAPAVLGAFIFGVSVILCYRSTPPVAKASAKSG